MLLYYNIKIFAFLIRIFLLKEIIPNNAYYSINFNSSKITLKIKGGGDRNIFCPDRSLFYAENHPNKVYINYNSITPIKSPHSFTGSINSIFTVDLEWNYSRDNYSHLFHGCPDIEEINFIQFETSQVKFMGSMFRECHSLTSIEFWGFKTTNVVDMGFMFQGCKKLASIDLSSFDTSKVTQMWKMFAGCSSLTSLDLYNFDTSKVTSMEAMFENCNSLISLNLNSFNTIHVSDMKNLFSGCENLEYIGFIKFRGDALKAATNMFNSVPNNVVVCINTINDKILTELNKKQCHTRINGCTSNWKSMQKKIIKINGKCVDSCISDNLYKYEYDNKCYDNCPPGTKDGGNNKCKCEYDKCLECPGEAYRKNLCTVCNINIGYYKKENERLNNGKFVECYSNLKGFYLDKDNSIFRQCYYTCETCEKGGTNLNHNCLQCKPNENCLPNDNKKTELINDINHNYLEYKSNSICLTKDKKNTELINDSKYNFVDILGEVNKIPKKEELNEYYDSILGTIENFFSLRIYDTSNIDKGEEEQISIGKMQVTLTTSENQKKNIYNDTYVTNNTLIDLNECEISLRAFYNISNDTSLYIQKIDVTQEGMQIPKVEFDVYSRLGGKKLQKLNLSICQNDKINIYTNIDSISNLDIINPTSGYYTDVCYPTTSDVGTDIILNDRKKEFVEKNKTVCQEDCNFVGYNFNTKRVNCSCDVKEASLFFENIIINRNKLYHNFLDINSIANIDFLFCYKMLFTKKGLLKNIGSYIVLLIILFHIICIIIFYIKSYPKLKKKINYIFKCKINLSTTTGNKLTKNKRLKYQKIFIQNNSKKINIKKKFLIKYKKQKRGRKYSKKHIKTNSNNNMDNYNKKVIKQNKLLNYLRYTDEEINDLSYELAIKSDKRTFLEYYISLLKTKHDIFFSFCYNKDYNARILKIDLFFLGFTMSYVINGLFFTDETMHKIYEDKGSFDFIYQFPKTIYSTIISLVLDYVIKLLALSNDVILDFKNAKLTKDFKKIKKYLIIKLRIKFLLYFISSSVLLILFWYYIGMFCVIYKNTQIHLIQDTIFSLIESSIYPIWINLFPGIFRIPALSNQKNNRRYLYKFSQFLQIL